LIRVLIVDDSATVRRVLSDELSKFPDIEVVGTAVDPYVARDRIVELKPDVVTLDVEMPRMDGLSFLAKLMKHHPIPVVIVSSLTQDDSELALRALALGAVDVVPKPGSVYSTPDVQKRLVRAIRAAAGAKMADRRAEPAVERPLTSLVRSMNTTDKVVALGASTGGTKALELVLAQMPAAAPATVIVQHMPAAFIDKFVERLDQISPMQVRVARDNDDLAAGVALVSPHGKHLLVQRSGARYVARLKDGPAVHYQRPSVDVLFNSLATSAGSNAVGVLMTGMGADGAKGLLAMREAGAHTIAESEASAIVFGMPKEAIALDAAVEVQPLTAIPRAILRALGKKTEPVRRPVVAG
jgi:two-component system chemotaxis response regulator CheB